MQKVQIDDTGAVLFFEDGEYTPPDRMTQEWLRSLAESTGIRLPPGTLTAECFRQNGRNVLFVTGAREPVWAVYRFAGADELMDAVRGAKHLLPKAEESVLYDYGGVLYLAVSAPCRCLNEALSEFGCRMDRDPEFPKILAERGRPLSAPSALSHMARYF